MRPVVLTLLSMALTGLLEAVVVLEWVLPAERSANVEALRSLLASVGVDCQAAQQRRPAGARPRAALVLAGCLAVTITSAAAALWIHGGLRVVVEIAGAVAAYAAMGTIYLFAAPRLRALPRGADVDAFARATCAQGAPPSPDSVARGASWS